MEKVGAYTDRATESGEWRAGNPASGQSATPMLAAYFNMLQRELTGVVEGAGIELDAEDDGQLLKAIKSLVGQAVPLAGDTDSATDFNSISSAGWYPRLLGGAAGSRNANHPNGQSPMTAGSGVANYYWLLVARFESNLLQLALPYVSTTDSSLVTPHFRVLGGGSWSPWRKLIHSGNQASSGVRGTFNNLKLSTTGLSAAVSVSVDEIALSNANGQYLTARNVNLSINSAAVGLNGLDTGVLSASTWYHVWLISNGTTTGGVLSLSSSVPVLPAGYTASARVGCIRTDATANKYPLTYGQDGTRGRWRPTPGTNLTAWPTLSAGAQGSAPSTWAAVGVSNVVPPTASAIAVIATSTAQNGNNIAVAPTTAYSAAAGVTNSAPLALFQPSASAGGGHVNALIPLESASIYVIATQITGSSLVLCTGWEDAL